MTRLVIGMESFEIKLAKRKVKENIEMLVNRLEGLRENAPSSCSLHQFYAGKIEEQRSILEWLDKFDSNSAYKHPAETENSARLRSSPFNKQVVEECDLS